MPDSISIFDLHADPSTVISLHALRASFLTLQEGYLEESLKIANVLREFDLPIPGGGPPAIVGFREHIFSGLGTLGTFAATAELVFGTLVQRTLARPLWCRYHYGHPDVMDKLALVSQGGLSKATKGLNLCANSANPMVP